MLLLVILLFCVLNLVTLAATYIFLSIKIDYIMTQAEAIKTLLDDVFSGLANVATDIDTLTAEVNPVGGLTEAEATDVVTRLTSLSDNIKALAAKTPDPAV